MDKAFLRSGRTVCVAVVVIFFGLGCATATQPTDTIRLLTHEEFHLPQEAIDDFTDRTGIEVLVFVEKNTTTMVDVRQGAVVWQGAGVREGAGVRQGAGVELRDHRHARVHCSSAAGGNTATLNCRHKHQHTQRPRTSKTPAHLCRARKFRNHNHTRNIC